MQNVKSMHLQSSAQNPPFPSEIQNTMNPINSSSRQSKNYAGKGILGRKDSDVGVATQIQNPIFVILFLAFLLLLLGPRHCSLSCPLSLSHTREIQWIRNGPLILCLQSSPFGNLLVLGQQQLIGKKLIIPGSFVI